MKFKYFVDYMRHQQDDNPLYLFESRVNEDVDIRQLVDDFEVPDLFPFDWLALLNHTSRPPYRWFCVGPRRSGATVHRDPLDTSAWNVVTHGRKRWVLFAPDTPKRVAKGLDVIRKGEDDEALFYFTVLLPRLKSAHPNLRVYEGIQNPGDLIFVPGGWWHGAVNVEDCVAVTQNYCGPDNFDMVWRRTRRDREKMNQQDGFRMRHERAAGDELSEVQTWRRASRP